MRHDDETSAEMDALRTQRLWHAYSGSDRRGPRSPLRRGLVAATVVALLALLAAFVSGVLVAANDEAVPATTVPPATIATTTTSTTTTTTVPLTVAVGVDSRRAWTDTGLDVGVGAVVEFTASGNVAHAVLDPSTRVGPDGDPRPEKSLANLVHDGVRLDGAHVGLIGRVGGGAPFVVGGVARLVMPAGGRLFLGVNDNGLDNNDGTFDVVVTVTP